MCGDNVPVLMHNGATSDRWDSTTRRASKSSQNVQRSSAMDQQEPRMPDAAVRVDTGKSSISCRCINMGDLAYAAKLMCVRSCAEVARVCAQERHSAIINPRGRKRQIPVLDAQRAYLHARFSRVCVLPPHLIGTGKSWRMKQYMHGTSRTAAGSQTVVDTFAMKFGIDGCLSAPGRLGYDLDWFERAINQILDVSQRTAE